MAPLARCSSLRTWPSPGPSCWTHRTGVPLVFANRKDIRLLELDASGRRANGSSQVLVEGLEDAAALDFFYEGRLLFWTDVGLEVIRRRSLDPSSSSPQDLTVASMGVVSPDGLACDWVGRKLYWTDSETNRLEVAELDGAHRKVLLWRDLDQPRAIALVPTDGLLFWTDWGDVPKIERASMDGNLSTRRAIVREDIFWPNGLTVDYQARRIYWVDAKLKLISSMDYDGKNRAVVIHGSLSLPFALTVLGDTLYWTDWQARAVLSCSKQTGGHKRTVLSGDLDPMDIQAYSPLRQPKGGGTPCSYNNGGCSHLCLVSSQAPFYSCACPTGVRLLNDSRTCAQGAEQILLLARRKDLRRISLDTPDYTDVVLPLRGLRHAIALDYDPVEGRVYWTDDELCLIQRAFLNGSGQEAVVTLEVQHPDGLAVDPVARNLYWTDTGTDRIEVARLNGTARKVLVAEDLAEPRAIVLDPPHGWMYWTDWGQAAKIERAALDGSERAVLVSTGLGWPNGLALDAQDGRLYWADARTDRIESARLDGSDRRTLLDDQLPHVFGFTLLGDYIYWTDWQGRSIERLPKDPSGGQQQRQVILDQLPDLMGLKAVSVRARPGTNDCSRPPNGGCSHLCLQRPRGQGRACACPTGLELRADLRGCTAPEAFLLYAQHDDVRRISLQSRRTDHVPLAGVREAAALDYDDGRLYWADTTLKRISRAFLNGSQAEPLVEFGLELPESLAVDWVGRNLYWADLALKRIEVSRLDGAHRRVLLWRGLDDPRALALEPSLRWMFWADWGSGGGGKGRRIERAALDGSQRLRLVTSQVGRVNSLSVDHGEQRLYWTDLDANHIESSDLAGERRRVVVAARPGQRPFGLAQYQEYLYWTDLEAHSIERALKANGADRSRLLGQLKYIDDLLVFHTSARRAGWNQCAVYNGGCSHLCLGVPGVRGYQCACPTHHPLGPNNRTCQRPQSFLLFSQKSSISRLGLEADDSPDVVLPIPGLKNIRALEYDPATDFLFWIDGKSHAIRRGRDNGTQVSALLPHGGGGAGHPYALALDPYGRQLFWSCSQGNLVNVSSPDDGRPLGTLLASGTDRPRHLALHPYLGVLVWSNLVVPALIERSFLDGSGRQTLVSGELRQPGALAMDCADERLYWSDVELRRVEHVRLGGDQRKVLLSNVQANALAVMGPHLFILDRTEQSILRAHKLTGAEVQPVQVRRSHLSALLAVRRLAAGHPCVGHSCSHLCRPVRGRAQCACPPGLALRGPSECVTAAPCTEREFACASGGCVALEARCDGTADCTDRSDERDCPPGCAPGAEFRCRDGGCVPKPRLCDGNSDCADGSDELCCGADRFACHSRDQCIDRSLVCNRRPDCVDRSDEVVCDAVSAGRPATTTVVLVIVFGSLTVLMAIGLCCYQQRARVAAAAAGHPAPVPHAAYRMLPYPKPPPSRPAPSSTASSNGTAYPRETLNPPPSPATVRSYGGPTPCSTDVCDDSEPCPCRFRCDDSLYDSDPNPPPPTPRSRGCVSDASCPPSPLNERAFCHPPPPSPVPESDY